MPATSVVVLSGKGGTAKTLWQMTMAGRHPVPGLLHLLIDIDPERNLSNRFNVPQHSTGLGSVFEQAGVTSGEGNAEHGAKRIVDEILATPWEGVEALPAGASLTGVSQVAIADTWLLRDIITAAGLPDRYDLMLFDTGGRTGSLVTLAMYAADVAYAPIAPTTDAVRKAAEAKARIDRIQRAHPLRSGRGRAIRIRRSGRHRGSDPREGLRGVRRRCSRRGPSPRLGERSLPAR